MRELLHQLVRRRDQHLYFRRVLFARLAGRSAETEVVDEQFAETVDTRQKELREARLEDGREELVELVVEVEVEVETDGEDGDDEEVDDSLDELVRDVHQHRLDRALMDSFQDLTHVPCPCQEAF